MLMNLLVCRPGVSVRAESDDRFKAKRVKKTKVNPSHGLGSYRSGSRRRRQKYLDHHSFYYEYNKEYGEE